MHLFLAIDDLEASFLGQARITEQFKITLGSWHTAAFRYALMCMIDAAKCLVFI